MRIDLHTHSTASDGTDSPAALMIAAAQAGLDAVALTDHDTMAGWTEAARAAATHNVRFVPGIELTAHSGGHLVHVLGYFPDPLFPPLVAEVNRIRKDRQTRAQRIVDRLATRYDLTWEDVRSETKPGTTIGRPHIADALVARGHFADRSAVFDDVLNVASRFYVPHYAPDALTAVRLLRAAGGVPVLAHPAAEGRGPALQEDHLIDLVREGLFGLEVDHRENTSEGKGHLRVLANAYGLVCTGSSDYHGAGKPNQLGENLTSRNAWERISAQTNAGGFESRERV